MSTPFLSAPASNVRKLHARAAALALIVATFIAGLSIGAERVVAAEAQDGDDPRVPRGRYLVTVAGCNDCHTPMKVGPNGPELDWARMLSGHPESLVMPAVPALPDGPWGVVVAATSTAYAGPWGVSFTANLTPDPETGLGRWTFRNFKDTIRSGRHLGRGREILPPMPIPMYKHFTDEDLEAIFAYLQSIPPIRNQVPEPRPPPVSSAAQ